MRYLVMAAAMAFLLLAITQVPEWLQDSEFQQQSCQETRTC